MRTIYHSWPGCCGYNVAHSIIRLDVLDTLVGTGNDGPCLRCFHGMRPLSSTTDVYIIGWQNVERVARAGAIA